jgi:flagellar export protein FliJ
MTSFRFPLQKVLDWRQTQLELEEVRFKQQIAALADLERARAELEATGIKAETQVRGWSPMAGCDLAALGSFRLNVKQRESEIALRRVECQKTYEAQQAIMLEARRRCRLLERLKDRRLADWTSARDHELDELASESFLSKWGR